MVHVQYPAMVTCQTCDFAVAPRGPGLRRVRRGRRFSYERSDGTSVTDAATLQPIKDLAIPPAWKKVWICPYPDGHIQAVGAYACWICLPRCPICEGASPPIRNVANGQTNPPADKQDKADAEKDVAKKETQAESARAGAKAAEKRQEAEQRP
jgi:hypothetical protein